jgi:hypothetical protein
VRPVPAVRTLGPVLLTLRRRGGSLVTDLARISRTLDRWSLVASGVAVRLGRGLERERGDEERDDGGT